jgi:peptidoglycan hydrolase-like protein with peptidoglycan-binding domain
MSLRSPRFANSDRLQRAADNRPPLRQGEEDEAVRLVQQALIELGFPMPVSTHRFGSPDGKYGGETSARVRDFQIRYHLSADGVAGRNTMAKLDELLPGPAAPLPPLPSGLPYDVPGLRVLLAQPSGNSCWATVYTMMVSWHRQMSFPGIREAIVAIDPGATKWVGFYDADSGLPTTEGRNFEVATHLVREPRMNLSIRGWVDMLRRCGLLWVSHAFLQGGTLFIHDRILEAMHGDGQPGGTFMKIMDPDGGRRYSEPFKVFLRQYELQAQAEPFYQDYQILHF